MVSGDLIRRWEAVYREYGMASEMVNNSEPGDGAAAKRKTRTSQNVDAVWRQMAAVPDMAWWLSATAQAFEYQARDWTARAKYDLRAAPGGGRERRSVYPVSLQQPGRHAEDGAADAV